MAHMSSRNADFVDYRRTGDPRLRDRIVEQHAGFAYAIARRFEGHGEERDDLRQIALIALTQAVERFDPGRGFTFTTFAAPTITGTLKRHLRDHTWVVRPPRAVNERALRAAAIREALTATLKRVPTAEEVAAEGGWERDEAEQALTALHARRVAQASVDVNDLENSPDLDDLTRTIEDRIVLDDLIEQLDQRERQVVTLRYSYELRQWEIAQRVGVSQMQVSRLLTQSMETLQHAARRRALSSACVS
jgi:RNA polymerase sigma-B factor